MKQLDLKGFLPVSTRITGEAEDALRLLRALDVSRPSHWLAWNKLFESLCRYNPESKLDPYDLDLSAGRFITPHDSFRLVAARTAESLI